MTTRENNWRAKLAAAAGRSALPLALVEGWRILYANPAFARNFAKAGDDARKIFDPRQTEQLRWLLTHDLRESDKVLVKLANGERAMAQLWPVSGNGSDSDSDSGNVSGTGDESVPESGSVSGTGNESVPESGDVSGTGDESVPQSENVSGTEGAGGSGSGSGVWFLSVRLEYSDERLADVDPLTRLPNRRGAEFLLRQEWERARRAAAPFCVAIADIDHFKRVNDEHGHQTGDIALRAAAQTLSRAMRSADWCARWGGEEFLLFLNGIAAADAVRPLDRIRERVGKTALKTDPPLRLTMSFGVAECDGKTEWTKALDAADKFLYEAKRAGRNRVVWSGNAKPAGRAGGKKNPPARS